MNNLMYGMRIGWCRCRGFEESIPNRTVVLILDLLL